MVNIPGILGFVQPGAFSRLIFQTNDVSLPGGVRNVSIVGLGQKEEVLVFRALGNGVDGQLVSQDFVDPVTGIVTENATAGPDGRHFQISVFPVVQNQFSLFKNGSELIRSRTTVLADDDPIFKGGADYAVDFQT